MIGTDNDNPGDKLIRDQSGSQIRNKGLGNQMVGNNGCPDRKIFLNNMIVLYR